jgi:hypothetical protein
MELPEALTILWMVRIDIPIIHRSGYCSQNFGDSEKCNAINGLKLARE